MGDTAAGLVNTNVLPVPVVLVDAAGNKYQSSALAGALAFPSNVPTSTGVNSDVAVKFGSAGNLIANHVMIANNTAINVVYELDANTSGGSDILAPGQKIFLDIQCAAVHLQAASAQNINGSAAGNIVVRGWL